MGFDGAVGELVGVCRADLQGGRFGAEPVGEGLERLCAEMALGDGCVGFEKGWLVEALPDVALAALVDEHGLGWLWPSDVKVVEMALLDLGGIGLDRQEGHLAMVVGGALMAEDAVCAVAACGLALHGAEVHDGLVEEVGPHRVDEGVEEVFKLALGGGGADGGVDAVEPCNEAVHVAVDDGVGESECEGGYGCRRIAANAFEGENLLVGAGENSMQVVGYVPGGGVEVAGAGVVAQSLPAFQHLFLGSVGQVLDGRVARDEVFVICPPLLYAGLLEDDFGQPDIVWIVRAPPGQIATVFVVPVNDFFSEHRRAYFLIFGVCFWTFEQVIQL